MKYSGAKSYNNSFKDEGVKTAQNSTTCKMVDLVPGSYYTFEVYGTSVCGISLSAYINVETDLKGEHSVETVNSVNYVFFIFTCQTPKKKVCPEKITLIKEATSQIAYLENFAQYCFPSFFCN